METSSKNNNRTNKSEEEIALDAAIRHFRLTEPWKAMELEKARDTILANNILIQIVPKGWIRNFTQQTKV